MRQHEMAISPTWMHSRTEHWCDMASESNFHWIFFRKIEKISKLIRNGTFIEMIPIIFRFLCREWALSESLLGCESTIFDILWQSVILLDSMTFGKWKSCSALRPSELDFNCFRLMHTFIQSRISRSFVRNLTEWSQLIGLNEKNEQLMPCFFSLFVYSSLWIMPQICSLFTKFVCTDVVFALNIIQFLLLFVHVHPFECLVRLIVEHDQITITNVETRQMIAGIFRIEYVFVHDECSSPCLRCVSPVE